MSEDKKSEVKPKVDWVIPRGRGVDVSNISPQKLQEIANRKNLSITIGRDEGIKEDKITADIDEVVISGLNSPKKQEK